MVRSITLLAGRVQYMKEKCGASDNYLPVTVHYGINLDKAILMGRDQIVVHF